MVDFRPGEPAMGAPGITAPADELRTIADWRRALDPGVVTDDGSSKPGDQIRTLDDFRRIGDQLTGGTMADEDATKLTGNDWKILKGILPANQQPHAEVAINRDVTPWQQKIRPLGPYVPTETDVRSQELAAGPGDPPAENMAQELARLGDTAEVNGPVEADLDDIRDVRPPLLRTGRYRSRQRPRCPPARGHRPGQAGRRG